VTKRVRVRDSVSVVTKALVPETEAKTEAVDPETEA